MRASTHVLTAGPEFWPVASVVRVRLRPPTLTVEVARTVHTPVAAEDWVIEQEPVVPIVLQLPAALLLIVKLIVVPTGALENPVPSFTLTCAVNVCGWPARFVAAGGVIWMFASTKVLTASTELPFWPFV